MHATSNTMRKIVVNAKHGGFGLSREAAADLGLEVDEEGGFMAPYRVVGEDRLARDDARLVQVVETLGPAASAPYAELVVVCIPSDIEWGIGEYDGAEWVAERHRAWLPTEHDAVDYQGVVQAPAAVAMPNR